MTVLGLGPDYTGGLLPVEHLLELALTLGILAVGAALGLSVFRRLGFRFSEPLDALVFGSTLGLGILASAILGVGSAGWLRGATLAGVVLAAAVIGRRELRGLPALLAGVARSFRSADREGEPAGGDEEALWPRVAILATGLVAVFLLVLSSAPPTDWDALMYHLQVPREFLEAGRIYLPRDNLNVTFVGLAHMLYLPLLAAGSAAALLS